MDYRRGPPPGRHGGAPPPYDDRKRHSFDDSRDPRGPDYSKRGRYDEAPYDERYAGAPRGPDRRPVAPNEDRWSRGVRTEEPPRGDYRNHGGPPRDDYGRPPPQHHDYDRGGYHHPGHGPGHGGHPGHQQQSHALPPQQQVVAISRNGRDVQDRPHVRNFDMNPVNSSVIFLGLPLNAIDTDLRAFLEDLGCSIDSTNVIMDRGQGTSKGFGFAKFSSVEHARSFVEPNFPQIDWNDPLGRKRVGKQFFVKINYARQNGGFREDQGSHARERGDAQERQAAPEGPLNDGVRDIGNLPSQILLLRGLDPLTTEEDIVAALGKLTDDGEPVIKRVMITRDRKSKSSWGYAFAQFADVQVAHAALSRAHSRQAFPTGWLIRSSPIAVSFTHENSFVPYYAGKSEISFDAGGGQLVKYWDDGAFVKPWDCPAYSSSAPAPAVAASKPKPQDDVEAFFSSIETEIPEIAAAVAVAAPTAGPGIAPAGPALGKHKLGAPVQQGELVGVGAADKLIQTRKSMPNIQKWAVKQKELNPELNPPQAAAAPQQAPVQVPQASPTSQPTAQASASSEDKEFEFGDTTAFICLLCQRQFKSIVELRRHGQLSALHKTNLANPATVAEAVERKAKVSAKTDNAGATPSQAETQKYIDRAAARREAFGQPEHPAQSHKPAAAPVAAPAVPDVQPNKDGIQDTNVGSKMLQNMGWSQGAALGTSGQGITAPIHAAQYAQGVGLGASKGTKIGTADNTPLGYGEQLREKARQRMDQLPP